MNLDDIATIFAWLEPELGLVGGRVYFLDNPPDTPTPDSARRSLQRDVNRRFIIADLLDEALTESVPLREHDPALLVQIARVFAMVTRQRLADRFPEREFQVEVIGEQGACDEPLEVAVTFFEP